MTSNSSSTSSGMSFGGWLQILFIGLKLTGFINWPWIWVLSPTWISICIVLAFLLIFALFYIISELTK